MLKIDSAPTSVTRARNSLKKVAHLAWCVLNIVKHNFKQLLTHPAAQVHLAVFVQSCFIIATWMNHAEADFQELHNIGKSVASQLNSLTVKAHLSTLM